MSQHMKNNSNEIRIEKAQAAIVDAISKQVQINEVRFVKVEVIGLDLSGKKGIKPKETLSINWKGLEESFEDTNIKNVVNALRALDQSALKHVMSHIVSATTAAAVQNSQDAGVDYRHMCKKLNVPYACPVCKRTHKTTKCMCEDEVYKQLVEKQEKYKLGGGAA